MELVASARLRKAQLRIEALRPYAAAYRRLMVQAARQSGSLSGLPLLQEREELNTTVEAEVQQIADQLDTDLMKFDNMEISPRKTDTAVDRVALLWLPYADDGAGNIERAF